MILNIENLTVVRKNGVIAVLEICRYANGDGIVGKIGTQKYKNWKFKEGDLGFLDVTNERFQEHYFCVDLENGDVSVYRDYGSGKPDMIPAANIATIIKTYEALGFDINLDPEHTENLKRITS